MRSSPLPLQQKLYARQKRLISARVQAVSPRFRAYQARYDRSTRSYRRVIDLKEVTARVREADVVYVGDYHTLRAAQAAYLKLAQRALTGGRRVVLALEFVEARHQAQLDAFLARRLKLNTFLSRIGHTPEGDGGLWRGFVPVLNFAQQHGVEVLAIDHRARGPSSLQRRDERAAGRIARAARAPDRPLVLVLMGQFHVAPPHLPREVSRKLQASQRRSLVVYQNAEGIWWQLARRGLTAKVRAVELSDGELCLVNSSPLVCQRTFLDYVEAEGGEEPSTAPATGPLAALERQVRRQAKRR